MAAIANVKAIGLNLSPNPLELPPGSLLEAKNIIIRRDDVAESRRGYKIYGESFGTSSDRTKQLMIYKGRILRHFASTLEFDSGVTDTTGIEQFSAFDGSYTETQSGLRIKSIESNGNFYFTTSNGIKKISAKDVSDLSTASSYITQSGGVKAIDLSASLNYNYTAQTDFFTQDSVVAYRVVWGIRDSNDNLILGAPSQRAEIYNYLTTMLLQDFMKVLVALDYINDGTCLISDGNYVDTLKLGISASASDLYTALISLAAKLDTDIRYADDNTTPALAPLTMSAAANAATTTTMRINISAGTPSNYVAVGSKVLLSGFGTGSLSSVNPNGSRIVSGIGAGYIDVGVTGLNIADTFTFAGAIVSSNEYGTITPPTAPNLPPTNADLVELQTYLNNIILRLQSENTNIIPSSLLTDFIISLDITTTSTVQLKIRIPDAVTTNHFYQIYRTSVSSATDTTVLSDLSAGDEMQLVVEAFPTSGELSAKEIVVEDITPDSFRGANLYTNPSSGEGILQANDNIPFAKDVNKFKNYVFYSNTRTRHFELLSLLGVTQMIQDYGLGNTPKLTITNGVTTNTYSFVVGANESTQFACVADIADSLNGKYFRVNSADDNRLYYVWYKTSGGAVSDPSGANTGRIGIRVNINTSDAASVVATKTRDVLNSYNSDFSASASGINLIINNVDVGYTTDGSAGTSGFTMSVLTQGRGESVSNKEVLLSSSVSPAQAVDETARSLVRVINKNASEANYGYYLSGTRDVPGKMQIEAKNLDDLPIYFLANNTNTGESFNPDISPQKTITSNSAANPTVITCASHGLINKDKIVISGSNSTPSIDGLYEITYISSSQFSINVTVTVAGSSGMFIKALDCEQSTNENKSNRIYYSKYQQPEAVPALNYLEVGTADDEILRVFPLRDSLFIFKKSGLYRLSGEIAPFSVSLFDSSCNLIASDSVGVVNNVIYCWTNAGISAVSEAGVSTISRAIDTEMLKLATTQYAGFKTSTWGIGYESDNSYTIYTVKKTSDEYATIGYRYSTLTSSWTTIDKSCLCGVINTADDKMYVSPSDINAIEQERKDFTRYDYSDREYKRALQPGGYANTVINLGTTENVNIGDVIIQEQLLSVYEFNMLLRKLDIDTGVSDTNYYTTLKQVGGSNLKTSLLSLATKLDADTGVVDTDYNSTIVQKTGTITANIASDPTEITTTSPHSLFSGRIVTISGSNSTPSIDGIYEVTVTGASTFTIDADITVPGTAGTWTTLDTDFRDIKACYNKTIQKLNADTGVSFSNYSENDTTTVQEAVVVGINRSTKKITVNLSLEYVIGEVKVFNAIDCVMTYAPQTMGDVLSQKQIREATMMFLNKAFTNATLSFASDLIPQFYSVDFNGDGSGIFGHQTFGSGFFGGGSSGAPFRTYVPANSQRCRYLLCKFEHKVAREQFGITGLTLVGEVVSTRAYR